MLVLLFTLVLVPSDELVGAVSLEPVPTYVSANSGQELTISCGGAGDKRRPTLCQWTKDGFGLGPEPELSGWPRYSLAGCHLRLDPVLPVDDGEYRCHAAGENLTKPFNATVTVSVHVEPGPPSINQAKLEDVMLVKEGQEIELVCQSQGAKPAAQIQWNQHNGHLMFSDVWKNVTRMGNLKTFKTLSRLKFKAIENINITCSAFNEGFPHPRTSSSIEIKIKQLPHIQMEFSNSKVKEGSPLEVKCFPSAEDKSLKYTWFINDSQMEEEWHNEGVLYIERVDKTYDKANIKCIAKNEDGEWEISQTLKIDFSPKIVIHPTNKQARVGETVDFTCQAEGSPEPKYIWFKGKSLELVGDSQNLTIQASEEAESEYICHVLTEGHQTVASNPARLQLKRKPRILEQVSKFGLIDKDIILECNVESLAVSRIMWTKNNEPINEIDEKYQMIVSQHLGKQQSHLIIFKLISTDFTDYGCFATNEVGTDYQIISLEQEKELDFLTILICSNVVLIMVISLGCYLYRHTKGRRDKKQLIFQKENPIYKNADTSIFNELLVGNKKEMNQDSIEIRQNIENMNLVSENTLM